MDSDDDNISILHEGLELNDVVSLKGATFNVTNVQDVEKEEDIYENIIPYDVLNRNELFKDEDNLLGLGFEEIGSRFNMLTDDNEIKKLIIKEGEGIPVPTNSYVSVHYDCYLEYADEPIDSTRCRKKPMHFKLAECHFETIEGFQIAIKSMRKKEISAFIISSNYAFGVYGCPPRIPPNASFLYFIELLSFEDYQDDYYSLPPSERILAPLDVMKKTALKFHKKGRDLFKEKKFLQASRIYQKEQEILESHHLKDEEEENNVKQMLQSLYENLALCNLKILNSGKCITYTNLAMGIKGETSKLLYCKGKAYRQLGQFSKAKNLLIKALDLLPSQNASETKDIKKEIDKLEKKWDALIYFSSDAYSHLKISETNITFEEIFERNIKLFKNDKELIELPFLCKLYSKAKIEMMKEIIVKHDLCFKNCINEAGEEELHVIKSSADLIDKEDSICA